MSLELLSPAAHLSKIRQVLNPTISDLATAFGVSRQAIYKWLDNESTPESDHLQRIRSLSLAADAFRDAGVARAASLLTVKAFAGKSMLDLVAVNGLLPQHTQALIAEVRIADAAYERSGLATSKATPTDAWLSELSIPGAPE